MFFVEISSNADFIKYQSIPYFFSLNAIVISVMYSFELLLAFSNIKVHTFWNLSLQNIFFICMHIALLLAFAEKYLVK